MSKSYKIGFVLFLLTSTVTCKNQKNKPTQKVKQYYSVKALGELKNESYSFCGITSEEIKYSYKVGLWKFITKEGVKIAEGKYDNIIKTNDSVGGCEFSYVADTIYNINKWKFWNMNGDLIPPNQELLWLINLKKNHNKTLIYKN